MPISLLVEPEQIKQYDIEILRLVPTAISTTATQIVYMVSCKYEYMNIIASQIRDMLEHNVKKQYFLVCVPKKQDLCLDILEKNGVYGEISLLEFSLGLIPVENNILSMETTHSFRDLFIVTINGILIS